MAGMGFDVILGDGRGGGNEDFGNAFLNNSAAYKINQKSACVCVCVVCGCVVCVFQ